MRPLKIVRWCLPVLPGLILAGHIAFYGSWIVDDAGIVFAYARNWVEGSGLVAFPGDPQVEGYTSPLGMALIAASMKLGLFHPMWTPKILGFALMLGAFWFLRTAARASFPGADRWTDLGLVLAALSPPLAVWTASGLENPLYALTVAGLVAFVARVGVPTMKAALLAGLLAGIIPWVRPDGFVFAALAPLVVLLGSSADLRRRLSFAAVASATTIGSVGLLTLWRWKEFGDVVSNTFHAKSGDPMSAQATGAILVVVTLVTIVGVSRGVSATRVRWGLGLSLVIAAVAWGFGLKGAPRAFAGMLGPLVLGVTLTSLVWAAPRSGRLVWLVATMLGLLAYLALPGDWMGEYRFATPFILIATPWATIEIGRALATLRASGTRWVLVGVACVALALLGGRQSIHALEYRERPAMPFQTVEQHFRGTFTVWAAELELDDAQVLLPDIGGALWTRTLQVRDLAGLSDRRIAKLQNDDEEMRSYILEDLRPEFIRIHGPWIDVSGLAGDPGFEADYVRVLPAGPEPGGDYVRRELLTETGLLERWRGPGSN